MPKPTPDQQRAIETDGRNLLILACAGSGKTETLARRIARMIKNGASRGSIAAFTFTDHAAGELKNRIRDQLETEVPNEPSIGDMYVGTIHSFCLRVLRERHPKYRTYQVIDETSQAALIAANFVRFEDSQSGIGLDRLRHRTRSKTYGETLRTFINTLNVIHQQAIPLKKLGDPILIDAVRAYRSIAYDAPNLFFDFNKIVDELVRFLEEDADALADLRNDLAHIFVDEYQDVDDRQEHLIRLLTDGGTQPSVTVVGDDDQALYGFRGASVQNILAFRKRYRAVEVTLNANFRSTHAIVSLADEAVRKLSERITKEPVALKASTSGELVERMADAGDVQLRTFGTEDEEAAWVADRIADLRGVAFEQADGSIRGLDYGDMAVLLRSVRSAGPLFAKKIRERGIPVVIGGTRGLFNNDEVRLIQASFCILARSEFGLPDDDGNFRLLSTVATRQFIRDRISALRSNNRLGPSANSTHFLSTLDRMRGDLDQRAFARATGAKKVRGRIYPQAIFHELLRELGSDVDEWPVDTLFNLGAFSRLLTQFEEVHQWITTARLKGLTLFLSNWAAGNVDEGGPDEVGALNSVKIMTVHGAKGLEWPVVFLPRVSSANFPSSLRNRGPDTFLEPGVFDGSVYVGGDDGERRLWYVGITRCAKFLNVSSLDRARKRPTAYFRELAHDCVRRNGEDPTIREKVGPAAPANARLIPTTYSDLATYWRCRYEYQLRALMKFSPGVREQFGYGQQVHNLLNELHEGAVRGDGVELSAVRPLVMERFHLRYTTGAPLNAMREAVVIGLERYVARYGALLREARAVEKPFELIDAESGALISGVVDLLERVNSDGAEGGRDIVGIIEFKSSRIDSEEKYLEISRAAEEQLRLYALGVRYALFMDPGHAALHIISHRDVPKEMAELGMNDRISVDVSASAMERTRERVALTVRNIREGLSRQEFSRTGVGAGTCARCDFRVFCKGYSEYKQGGGDVVESTPEEDADAELSDIIEDTDART